MGELAKMLAAVAVFASVASAIVGPVVARWRLASSGHDPLVNRFRSVYVRASGFADETERAIP